LAKQSSVAFGRRAAERPLLIDPGAEDPTRKIRFVRLAGHWSPIPRTRGLRAKKTIEVISLDADDLLEHYDARVRNEIDPLARAVEDRIAANDAAGARAAWKEATTLLFGRTAPFKALARDVLDARFPRPLRKRYRLVLPRPRGSPAPI
jgi:hypothetical protein